jgi:tetratricopeptide (TPR) repeat protein
MMAWCRVQLGHLHLSIGELKKAEQQYSAALQIFPNYFQALLGMGRVLAADKKFEQAIDFYRQSTAIVPQMEAVAELGDLLALLDRKEDAEQQYALIEAIEQLNRSHQVQPDAWLSLFYADHGRHLDQAMAIAENQIARRKDIRTYDALAWAYYQAGHYAEADRAMDQALRLGTRNAGLFFHAGMIKAKLGLTSAAIDFLARALQVNSAFHPQHATQARQTLKMLSLREE